MKSYDIAICGGAMVGATLALALDKLCERPLSIAVIEPFQVAQGSSGFDARAIALSYGTRLILERFGLWSEIEKLITPIKHIHVSDQGHAGITEISHKEYDLNALGYVVELEKVGMCLHQQIEQSANIDFLCPDAVVDIVQSESENKIKLSSGQSLICKLLVAADGADSTCCKLLKITSKLHDFKQTAVIANVTLDQPHSGHAFERFTPQGPLALLPMPTLTPNTEASPIVNTHLGSKLSSNSYSDNRMSLVWCLSSALAEEALNMDDYQFSQALQDNFGWKLGKVKRVGERASYPLVLNQKEQLIFHRFAVVGNAAQLLHPIAGQGFNLGVRDIESLVNQIVKQAVSENVDIGEHALLAGYRQCREEDRNLTIGLTTTLVHTFSNKWKPLQVSRNLALIALDTLPLLKRPLLKKTMGLL